MTDNIGMKWTAEAFEELERSHEGCNYLAAKWPQGFLFCEKCGWVGGLMTNVYTKVEMNDSERATLIIKVVVDELKNRAGFSSWWNRIDTTTREDLIATLNMKAGNCLK